VITKKSFVVFALSFFCCCCLCVCVCFCFVFFYISESLNLFRNSLHDLAQPTNHGLKYNAYNMNLFYCKKYNGFFSGYVSNDTYVLQGLTVLSNYSDMMRTNKKNKAG